MLEDDNKTSESFIMDADEQTLLLFRALLYCQKVKKTLSVPEFISLFSFCDFVLWEEGKQILLGQFEEVLKQVDVLHVLDNFFTKVKTRLRKYGNFTFLCSSKLSREEKNGRQMKMS